MKYLLLFLLLISFPAQAQLTEPAQICEESFDAMVAGIIAQGVSMGQNPTEADIAGLRAMNYCSCVYEIMPRAITAMDYDKANEDLIDIENWMRQVVMPELFLGSNVAEWERALFAQTLNYQESLLAARGLAQGQCLEAQAH
jgi:hypothetical protein